MAEKDAASFIDESRLEALAAERRENPARVREALARSRRLEALTEEETAALLAAESPELLEEIFNTARELKKRVYGNRIVLFAPLYVGNHCINDCRYCGFRRSLRTAVRHTLSDEELIREVKELEKAGHKRLILVYGEHASYTPEFIAHTVRLCYETRTGHGGEIRRVNINAAPLSVEGFRTVKAAGIGTYQIFQETYHTKAYAAYHPGDTCKGDYLWRLTAMDRAFEGGCDDVGLGVLFGLHDWRFEVLALVSHARYLQNKFGVGPHTVSFPRLKPAHGLEQLNSDCLVSDGEYKRLVAILRLAMPYTGLIMTAREPAEIRNEVIDFGVSQIDAGTRLEIGGYQEPRSEQKLERGQFRLGDHRELDEVIEWLVNRGDIPSFCTSCYRLGRTGEHFMEYAIPGFIGNFCTPNALLTLAEYLEDYGSEKAKTDGYRLIDREIAAMNDENKKDKLKERLVKIKQGRRDLYF